MSASSPVSPTPSPEQSRIASSRPRGSAGLWGALLLFALTRWWVWTLHPAFSDVPLYYDYAAKLNVPGQLAYRDVPIEYPPLGVWVMQAPTVSFPSTDWTDSREVKARTGTYVFRFRGLNLLLDVVGLALLANLLTRWGCPCRGSILVAYVLATGLLGHLLFDRLDLMLSVLMLLFANFRDRAARTTGLRSGVWLILAYAACGAGISFKLIPVILLPGLLCVELVRPWRLVSGSLGLLLTGAGPFLVFWLSVGPQVLDFLKFHQGRGLHVESVAATIPLLGHLTGLAATVKHEPGGFIIEHPWSKAAGWMADGVLVLLILWSMWRGWRTRDSARALLVSLIVLAGAVACAKVLSPQYLIWSLPAGLLAAAGLGRSSGTLRILSFGAVLIAALSTWIFPYHYFCEIGGQRQPLGLIPCLDMTAVLVLIVRNLLYVGWCVVLTGRGKDRHAG